MTAAEAEDDDFATLSVREAEDLLGFAGGSLSAFGSLGPKCYVSGGQPRYRRSDLLAWRHRTVLNTSGYELVGAMLAWRVTYVEDGWLTSPFARYELGHAPKPLQVVERAFCKRGHIPPQATCPCGIWATVTAEAVAGMWASTARLHARGRGLSLPTLALARYELAAVLTSGPNVRARTSRIVGPIYAAPGADLHQLAHRYKVLTLAWDGQTPPQG